MKKLLAIIGVSMIVIALFRTLNGAGNISISNVMLYLNENTPKSIDISAFDSISYVKDAFNSFTWSSDLNILENIAGILRSTAEMFIALFNCLIGLSVAFIGNIFMSAVNILKLIWYLFGFGG